MSTINFAIREINFKIVYYGPGLSGKTTNLKQIYERQLDGSITTVEEGIALAREYNQR